ncbi:MAG: hypothetical protein MUC48_17705, partial [Leptolyngbya sp. Prado105]|nr:hypothetical protein [Leptolyngbya sp. Prado105]
TDEDESVAFEPVIESVKDSSLWRATYCDGHELKLQIRTEYKNKPCKIKNYEQDLRFFTYALDYRETFLKISSLFLIILKIVEISPNCY